MPAEPIAIRLPEDLEEELNCIFAASGEHPADGIRRIVGEWWTMVRFPMIEFRDGVRGRRASLRGGPDVWEIVMVARDYGDDRDGLYQHFSWITPEQMDEALAYARVFAAGVNARVEANERAGENLLRCCPRGRTNA
jgi:uncharacterized protein (DUF433 family)